MAVPYTSFGTVLGVGQESTYGTAAARGVWFPVIRSGLQRKPRWVPRATISESTTSRNRRGKFLAEDMAGGPVTLEMTYEGFGYWLKHLLGQVSTAGTGPYVHTFSLSRALPTGLTLEEIRGDSGSSEVFNGCKVGKGTITVEAGKVVTFAADIIARTSGGRVAAGTATHTTSRDLPLVFSEAGSILWNALTLGASKLEFAIDNKVATRLQVGSAETKEPTPSDAMDVLVSVDVEYTEETMWTAFLAGTTSDLTVTFTSGARSLAVNANAAYIESMSDPIEGNGIIKRSVTFRCTADAGSEGFTIALTNTQSDAVAA